MRIHITGASGSGTTTLGRDLAAQLGCEHFDSDDYFWLPTEPPYPDLFTSPAVPAGPRRRSQRLSASRWPLATASSSILDLDAACSTRIPLRLPRTPFCRVDPWIHAERGSMRAGLMNRSGYQAKRDRAERDRMLLTDLRGARACVESGSLLSWNDEIKALFDAVILLWIPPEVRLERLRARELRRLGRVDDEFMEWAATYDQPGNRKTRSRLLHEEWLEALACPVLKLEGDLSPEERLARSLRWLRSRPGSDSRRKP